MSLQPGFKVEAGAHFVAKPQMVVNGLKSNVEQTVTTVNKNVVSYLTPSQYNNKVYDYNGNEIKPHSVAQFKNTSKITIYPNPASNELFISCNDSTSAIINVGITNLLGVLLKTCNVQSGQSIDISALPQGVYFIRAECLNQRFNYKLIKE